MNTKFLYACIFLGMLAVNCFAQDTIYLRNNQRIACNIVEINTTEVKYKKWELSEGPLYIENKASVAQVKYKNGFVDVFQEMKTPQQAKKADDDYVPDHKSTKNGNVDYYPSTGYVNKLVVIGPNHYLYGNKRMNEKAMQQLLLSVNDRQITKEVNRARVDKGLKYIGFLAIPFAIGAIACATQIDAYPGSSYYTPGTTTNDEFIAPTVIFAVGAAATFSASIYFGIDRKARNARAIRLYQQKYEDR